MKSDFDTMLLKDNAVPIHIRSLQLLMIEIYKTKWELNPTFMKDIFIEKHSTYGLRSCHNLLLPHACTTCYGLETISFLGSRLWQPLPNDMKQSDTLSSFKRIIKSWKEPSKSRTNKYPNPLTATMGRLIRGSLCFQLLLKARPSETDVLVLMIWAYRALGMRSNWFF